MRLLEDELGNKATDPRDAGTLPGESFLFCLTASALNRKSTSGNEPRKRFMRRGGQTGWKTAHQGPAVVLVASVKGGGWCKSRFR